MDLVATGGIGDRGRSVTIAAGTLTARTTNADEYLGAVGTVQLADKDALDAGKGTVHLTAGTFQDDGAINSAAQVAGATLSGLGAVNGPLDAAAGTVSPGEPTGVLMAGAGDVTMHAGSVFNAALVSPDELSGVAGVLVGQGNVNLGGATLTFSVDPSYVPFHFDHFTILRTAGTITGTFAGGPTYAFGGPTLVPVYSAHSVVLVVDHPAVAAPATLDATENAAATGTLAATDADGDNLTYAVATQPTKGTVTILDAATGAYKYTPKPGADGTDSFTFVANDGVVDSPPAAIAVNIAGIATAPTLKVAAARGNENAAIPLNIAVASGEVPNPLDVPALLLVRLSGVPADAVLSAGTKLPNGDWLLAPANLTGLTYTSPTPGVVTLTVTATSTEVNAGGAAASTVAKLAATVVDPPVAVTGGFKLSSAEGSSTGVRTLATFTDPAGALATTHYGASVNWGDGTALDKTATISVLNGVFTVQGSHTYRQDGAYAIAVMIAHDAAWPQTATSTAQVADLDRLTAGAGLPAGATAMQDGAFSGVVANFTDAYLGTPAGGFVGVIRWGDGTASFGTVSGANGRFVVSGGHTYLGTGTFAVTMTIVEAGPGKPVIAVNSSIYVAPDPLRARRFGGQP